ncbi:ABC transporter permease [Flagellimonas flava]|uniref:MacB-like core domain-containing protein n=1 Tax=Flagellimonas flava TaxID=570519 RepID=A0A1M5KVX2_9FLAO|nr:ABC transporter permease [Allomuricauda flava]SHG56964.1 MacB-like core domain-containing protein [Allomuricauda flava]
MLKHNIVLFLRNIKRNKSSFLINMIGLSTGIACTLLISLWVMDELGVDKFHEKHNRIYQVIEHLNFSDGVQTMIETFGPMAELLTEEFPEVEFAAEAIPPSWFGKHNLSIEKKSIKAVGQIVGKDYFNIFSYGLLSGNKDDLLNDPNSIVISKELALGLFGTTENIIGQVITYEQDKRFMVSGIFEGTPANSTVQFDFALSSLAYKDVPPWTSLHSWNGSGPKVYVQLKEGADIVALNAKVDKLRKSTNPESIRTAVLVPFADHYLYGTYENGKQIGGRIQYVKLFSIIALIILVIACINFMNLSTARATKRLKEIGVKKAVGATRRIFIAQFLGESLLMAFIALIISLTIVALFLPQFNLIVGKQLSLIFDFNLVLILLSITIFTGLIAGSYPAIYLSGFNAITVLKGKLNQSFGELWTRKGLVIVQFALSIILIASVLVVYMQMQYIQNQNLGYTQDNIVHFNIEGQIKNQKEAFITELKKLPSVQNASSTTHSMVGHNWSVGLDWEGRDQRNIAFQVVGVDYDFIETMNMDIMDGRGFSKEFGADSLGLVFNETAIRTMNVENPIGKIIRGFFGQGTIIGVVEDFHFKSLHDKVEPLFLTMMPQAVKKIMVRIEAGKEEQAIAEIQQLYKTFNPSLPFEYEFLDKDFQELYNSEQRVATLSKYFAGLAILISCLGLFGLVIFSTERRRKEISIRKVLGQEASQITLMLSSEFAKLVLTSAIIAIPIAYMLISNWLSTFSYHISLNLWYFLSAGLIAMLIAMLTVGSQAISAANKNPVGGLREE